MTEPLFLTSQMHPKIWGGTKLKDLFNYDIPSEKTGEYWAISAHPNGVSTVINGTFANRSLDDLYQNEPQLFGNPKDNVFPLLTKILDANDWLSVQVHPDDSYALKHEGELGKTECWYILSAEEGSEIIYGHQAKNKEELTEWLTNGKWEKLLTKVPVKAGDFFYVPSGTLHAIGKGIVILETQQSSDTTYRVYDFDRKDEQGQLRDLHLKQALEVTSIEPPITPKPIVQTFEEAHIEQLVSNAFFTVNKLSVNGQFKDEQKAPYLLVSIIEGTGKIIVDSKEYAIQKGSHFILPNTVKEWTFSGHLSIITSHIAS